MDANENKETKHISIDLSKISNLSAMKDENPSVNMFIDNNSKTEHNASKKEETISKKSEEGYKMEKFEKYPRKFEFVPAEKVMLPSHGLPYSNCSDPDVRSGYVWIYPLTMKEEEILSTGKYIYEGTATIMALNNCLKSNIDAMDLTVSDFYYLLMYLRKISISDKFIFSVKCPACGHSFTHEIKISEQKFDELTPETFNDPIRIDLPVSNYTVLLAIPRIRTIRELSWIMSSNNDVIGISDYLCVMTIAVIDNNGNEVPKEDWKLLFNNLPHKDSEILIKQCNIGNGTTNMTEKIKCPECGELIEGSEVELNSDALFRYE